MKPTVAQRFWDKVDASGECWLWTSSLASDYGRFWMDGKYVGAHRVSYELTYGAIPDGMLIDHRATCPKHCVNPAHLRVVTHSQNQENRCGATKASSSGARGVSQHHGKWRAQVQKNGHTYIAGYFDTIEEAADAVRRKRLELFTHNDLDRLASA